MIIRPENFIHPEDASARRQMEAIPGFSSALKTILRIGLEQFFHGTNMASKIRLGPNQLPEIYQRIKRPCVLLGIEEPEFYLEMSPVPNAYTFGDTRTFLTITSALLHALESDEVDAVIAHECGHIVCRHVLYHTMGRMLASGAGAIGVLGSLSAPIQLGLLYWSRRSELSADRAAAAVFGSETPVVDTMIRLAGGSKQITGEVNVQAYADQADAYDTLQTESTWDKLLQTFATMNLTHPFPAVRVREILKWSKTEAFTAICSDLHDKENAEDGSLCPTCNQKVDPGWNFCRSCGRKLKQTQVKA